MSNKRIVTRLRRPGTVFAEDEAALLLAEAVDTAGLAAMLDARVGGLPLEPSSGWAEFCGIRVRWRRACSCRAGARRLVVPARRAGHRPGDVAVDLCCGTGALGAALPRPLPGSQVYAADVDPAAVACARRNLTPDRVHEGDLYAALPDDLRRPGAAYCWSTRRTCPPTRSP